MFDFAHKEIVWDFYSVAQITYRTSGCSVNGGCRTLAGFFTIWEMVVLEISLARGKFRRVRAELPRSIAAARLAR